MKWYNDPVITKSTAEDFIDELSRLTKEYFINNIPQTARRFPFKNHITKNNLTRFEPKGVIIHSTQTPSLINALNMQAYRVYGTHFIICSINHRKSSYPLLKEIPATILMLYPPDQGVYHSGYLSPHTWSIDLRNAGRLRPWPTYRQELPIRLNARNIQETHFLFPGHKSEYQFFWKANDWRYPYQYNRHVRKYKQATHWNQVGYYEYVSTAQMISLIVLIKVLHALYDGLDERMVFPSNILNNNQAYIPGLPMDQIRNVVFRKEFMLIDHTKPEQWIKECTLDSFGNEGSEEISDIRDPSNTIIKEQLEEVKWRSGIEKDKIKFLFSGKQYSFAKAYGRVIHEHFGTSNVDPNFNVRLWANANNMAYDYDESIRSKLHKLFVQSTTPTSEKSKQLKELKERFCK